MLWPPEIIEKQLLLQMDGEGNNGFASTAPLRANPGTGTVLKASQLSPEALHGQQQQQDNMFGIESLFKECTMYLEAPRNHDYIYS